MGNNIAEVHRINEKITSKTVRIVGENVENGIYSIYDALKLAEQMEQDLIEISPTATPPVCKILDYQKFLYQLKKKQKELKEKSSKTILKEIRFTSNTYEHDYNFKKRHIEQFLREGAKVRAVVIFKGRSINYKEKGEILLLKLAQEIEDLGKTEHLPKLEGKKMSITFSPKRK